MAGRKTNGIRPSAYVQTPSVKDSDSQRAFDALTDAVQALQTQRQRVPVIYDLVVGTNRVTTGLGRRAQGCTLTPTVTDAMFAWSFAVDDDRTVIITVIGAAQPACPLEIW